MEKFFLKSISRYLLTLLALFISACSATVVDPVYGIDSNTLVEGSFTQFDNAKITGTGKVRLNSTLPTTSSRSLSLKVSLDQSGTTSRAGFIFYSPNQLLTSGGGVVVTFTRSGSSVVGTINLNGTERTISASRLLFYYPALLDLIIDVSNSGSQTRVLIWRKDKLTYTASNADVDSERSGDLTSLLPTSTAAGGVVGFDITNATVSEATIGLAKVLN